MSTTAAVTSDPDSSKSDAGFGMTRYTLVFGSVAAARSVETLAVCKQHDLVVWWLVGGVGWAVWWRKWHCAVIVRWWRWYLRRRVTPTRHVVERAAAVASAPQDPRSSYTAVRDRNQKQDDGKDEDSDAENAGC